MLAPVEGSTGAGVTELAGALETGTGGGAGAEEAGAGEEEVGTGALLDGTGTGAWLEGTGTIDEAGTELGAGTTLVEGSGLDSPFFTGTMFFFSINKAWVTSRADSCWPTPEVPSHAPVYHLEPHVLPSVPPEQDLAAPTADALRYFVIVSLVKGAMIAVLAKKRDR